MEIEFESEYQLEIKNQFYDSLDEVLRYLLEVSVKSHNVFKKEITACIDKIFVFHRCLCLHRQPAESCLWRHRQR